jgi:hypothetical protein
VEGPAGLKVTVPIYVIGFPIGFVPQLARSPIGIRTRGTIEWPPRLSWQAEVFW